MNLSDALMEAVDPGEETPASKRLDKLLKKLGMPLYVRTKKKGPGRRGQGKTEQVFHLPDGKEYSTADSEKKARTEMVRILKLYGPTLKGPGIKTAADLAEYLKKKAPELIKDAPEHLRGAMGEDLEEARGSEAREMRALLKSHGYDPADVKILQKDDIGPEELRRRLRVKSGAMGSLEYTHNIKKLGEDLEEARGAKELKPGQVATFDTRDLGNNESSTISVAREHDGHYTAVSHGSSKGGFKTYAGAVKWLQGRTGRKLGTPVVEDDEGLQEAKEKGEKVTIYSKAPVGIAKAEGFLTGVNDSMVTYIPKGGRRERAVMSYYAPFWMVVKGWKQPEPSDPFGKDTSSTKGVSVQKAHYRSTDPRWVSDFLEGPGKSLKPLVVHQNGSLKTYGNVPMIQAEAIEAILEAKTANTPGNKPIRWGSGLLQASSKNEVIDPFTRQRGHWLYLDRDGYNAIGLTGTQYQSPKTGTVYQVEIIWAGAEHPGQGVKPEFWFAARKPSGAFLNALSKRFGSYDAAADHWWSMYQKTFKQEEWFGIIDALSEESPPGWAGTVKAMKKHMPDKKAFALAWTMYKKGDKPHYKDTGSSTDKEEPEKKKKYKEEAANPKFAQAQSLARMMKKAGTSAKGAKDRIQQKFGLSPAELRSVLVSVWGRSSMTEAHEIIAEARAILNGCRGGAAESQSTG